jgi:hypothetical protein
MDIFKSNMDLDRFFYRGKYIDDEILSEGQAYITTRKGELPYYSDMGTDLYAQNNRNISSLRLVESRVQIIESISRYNRDLQDETEERRLAPLSQNIVFNAEESFYGRLGIQIRLIPLRNIRTMGAINPIDLKV